MNTNYIIGFYFLPEGNVRYVTPNQYKFFEVPQPRLVVRHSWPRVWWRGQYLSEAAVIHARHVAEIEGSEHGTGAGAKSNDTRGVYAALQTEALQLRQPRQQPTQLLGTHCAPVEHHRCWLPLNYALYVGSCHPAVGQTHSRPQPW